MKSTLLSCLLIVLTTNLFAQEVEQIHKRTPHSKTFQLGAGRFKTEIHSNRIHVPGADDRGSWCSAENLRIGA